MEWGQGTLNGKDRTGDMGLSREGNEQGDMDTPFRL